MNAWLEIGLSNAAVATVLAIAALLVTRLSRRPELALMLWVLVLAKLLVPPLVSVPGLSFAPRDAVVAASRIRRSGPFYLKVGLAGVPGGDAARTLISIAVEAAALGQCRPIIVPVAYADWERAGSPPPEAVLSAAMAPAGPAGIGSSPVVLYSSLSDSAR